MRYTPERRREVLDAANQLIVEAGLSRFSMLALAQRLAMSKETLYAWFGSKAGLMAELVQGNAGSMVELLRRAAAGPITPDAVRETLQRFCTAMLALLCSDRSVAINRGAIHLADSGEMAQPLRAHGRDAVLKLLAGYLQQARGAGVLHSGGPSEAEVLTALALRDWQIDRLLGRMPSPSAQRIRARAREAVDLFWRLYGNGGAS